MLEEFAMEKKSSGRTVQAPVKGNSTESKKNQELVSNSKVFTRAGRRREQGTPGGPRNDGKKSTVQKNKTHDRRPRAKGNFPSGKEGSQVAGVGAGLEPVTLPRKGKLNLNHLLNFHYAPREVLSTPGNWRYQPIRGRKTIATHKHKYQKEQFLQANCQFVVKQASDYSEHLKNPDLLVEWTLIEEILIRSGESLACPICLYPPVAAKITRCGHVFCWSCILHYLALSDKESRKCPICFEAVHKSELKSVIPIVHNHYSVGDEVTMRLMRRERGSLLPVPVDQDNLYFPKNFLSVSEKDVDTGYSKLLLASPEEVTSIINREKLELEDQLVTNSDCPEKCFIEQALEHLKERELLLLKENAIGCIPQPCNDLVNKPASCSPGNSRPVKQIQTQVGRSPTDGDCRTVTASVTEFMDEFNRERNQIKEGHQMSCSSTGCGNYEGTFSLSTDDIEMPMINQASSTAGIPAKKFFFYQAVDGQHMYLHALNVRMLEHQYGSLEHCPRILKGKILEIESGSMTEELRNRLRYLQHLPVTCQFEIAEIHLKQPIISKDTVLYFEDQLDIRKRNRQRRARDESRRAKKISAEEKRFMGRYPSPSICLDSHMQFPSCGTDPDLLGHSTPQSPSSGSGADSSSVQFDISTSMSHLTMEAAGACYVEDSTDYPSGPSFAQMLREGKSKKVTLQVPEQRKPIKNMEPADTYRRRSNSSAECSEDQEDYVPVPAYKPSLSEAISKAMENVSTVGGSMQDGDGSSGKKKKKKKQKILFATGMNFTNK